MNQNLEWQNLEWNVRHRLSAEAEQDLGRRFASASPGYLLLMSTFAFGSGCWEEHATPVAIFAALAAAAGVWHQMMARSIAQHYAECPAFWRASLRRAAYASAAMWGAFVGWAGITHVSRASLFLLAVVSAVAAAGLDAALGADELVTERCLLLMLVPVVGLEMAYGAFALAAASLMLLGFLVAQARAQSVTYWERIAQRADLELRADKAERALVSAVETDAAAAQLKAIRGILGVSTLLLETGLDAQQREYAQIIQDVAVSLVGTDAAKEESVAPAPAPVTALVSLQA